MQGHGRKTIAKHHHRGRLVFAEQFRFVTGSGQASLDATDSGGPREQLDSAEDFPEAVVDGVANFIGKPRARGWIHVYAAVIAAICGATLVSVS